ncbi:MAG: acyl carrier protein [Acidobacteriota bacterium]
MNATPAIADESFVAKLAQLGKIEPAGLTDTTEITPADWDSVDVLDLIAAIDESFGVTVATSSLNECRTVGELRTLIHAAATSA